MQDYCAICFVVKEDASACTQCFDILHQVICEGVVVIYDHYLLFHAGKVRRTPVAGQSRATIPRSAGSL